MEKWLNKTKPEIAQFGCSTVVDTKKLISPPQPKMSETGSVKSSAMQTNDLLNKKKGFQSKIFKDNITSDQKISFFDSIEKEFKFSSIKKDDYVLNKIKNDHSTVINSNVDWRQLKGAFTK